MALLALGVIAAGTHPELVEAPTGVRDPIAWLLCGPGHAPLGLALSPAGNGADAGTHTGPAAAVPSPVTVPAAAVPGPAAATIPTPRRPTYG